jgi:hypothetical protein
MKKATLLLTILTFAVLGANGAGAEGDPIEKAIEACKPEIEAYCSQVTPGDGRLLACFYAHEDKLSGRCGWALYEGAAQLEQFAAAVTHVANQCWDDLVEHCGEVEMGEGRVASCLLEHKAEVSEGCSQAIDDVGLEAVED